MNPIVADPKLRQIISNAITEEREACAELAERWAKLAENNGMDQAAWALSDLAKAMRERGDQ